MEVCPKCGAQIDDTWGVCTLCGGGDIKSGMQQSPQPQLDNVRKRDVCPTCGNILAKGVNKCPKCGYKIPQSKKITLAVTIATLLLIGSCVVCVTNTGKDTNTPANTSPKSSAPTSKPSPATFSPITLRGTDSTTTPPFTITTKEWVIDWSYSTSEPDFAVFGFFVYPRGETNSYVESVLFPKANNGTTYSYAGPGEYYIKTNVGNINQWEITISPAK